MMLLSRRKFSFAATACFGLLLVPNYLANSDAKKNGNRSFALALIEEVETQSLEELEIGARRGFDQIMLGPYIVSQDDLLIGI